MVNSESLSNENSLEKAEENVIDLNKPRTLVDKWAIENGLSPDEVGDFIGGIPYNPENIFNNLFENIESDMDYGDPYQGGFQDTGNTIEDTDGKFIQPYKVEKLFSPDEGLIRRSRGIQILAFNEELDANEIYKKINDALIFDNDFLNRLGLRNIDKGNSKEVLTKIGEKLGRKLPLDVNQLNERDILDIARLRFDWPLKGGDAAYLSFKMKRKDGSTVTGIIFAHSKAMVMPGKFFENGEWKIDPDNNYNILLEAQEVGRYDRWDDAERKLLVTMLDKFKWHNLQSVELKIASEQEFCRSCKNIIENFLNILADIYGKEFIEEYPELLEVFNIPHIIMHYYSGVKKVIVQKFKFMG